MFSWWTVKWNGTYIGSKIKKCLIFSNKKLLLYKKNYILILLVQYYAYDIIFLKKEKKYYGISGLKVEQLHKCSLALFELVWIKCSKKAHKTDNVFQLW